MSTISLKIQQKFSFKMPKRKEIFLFEEPLIEIDMQPTEETDPLSVDPKDNSAEDGSLKDDTVVNFDIFSYTPAELKPPDKPVKPTIIEPEGVKIKQEIDGSGVYIKEEPSDFSKEVDTDDTADALAKALTTVKYLCPKCNFRSTDKEEVRHHTSNHRPWVAKPRPCKLCNFVGKTVRSLIDHKRVIHPRMKMLDLPTLPSGEFKCPHCDFKTFHRGNLRSHTKLHTQDMVFFCDKCPYTCISKYYMEFHAVRHLRTKSRRYKYECPHCGMLEKTRVQISRHLVLHGEGAMRTCSLCPYKSPYNHVVTQHMKKCHGSMVELSENRHKPIDKADDNYLLSHPKKKRRWDEYNTQETIAKRTRGRVKWGLFEADKDNENSLSGVKEKKELTDELNQGTGKPPSENTQPVSDAKGDEDAANSEQSSRLRQLLQEVKDQSLSTNEVNLNKTEKGLSDCESDSDSEDSEYDEDGDSICRSELSNEKSQDVSCGETLSNATNQEGTSNIENSNNASNPVSKEELTFPGRDEFGKNRVKIKDVASKNSFNLDQQPRENEDSESQDGICKSNKSKKIQDIVKGSLESETETSATNETSINESDRTVNKISENGFKDGECSINEAPGVIILKKQGNTFSCFRKLKSN